ncbi:MULTISPECIES: cobyric acid synthase [Salinibaculum]|uniref:cobyric acid synthase n=1 Tax=Salinibaculum TaxID=2732368 RepID=UPI0030CEB297
MSGPGSEATARTLLVAGTASHVGKTTVAAGLCRLLADRGVDVVPYKAQNMSNNARAVPGGEIGVSQYVQARAARVPASVDMNPVLLKPTGEGESQVVVHGEAIGHESAGAYYDDRWEEALAAARKSHERLAGKHDVVVAEGAGSIAEPNLRERDLANVETARFADADVLLVGDIERGGVFASLVGTLELLPADLRKRVVGAVITKFRGDREILRPGVEDFEDRTGLPVLGVLPYDDPGLPAEDSVSLPPAGERAVRGADDGVPDGEAVTVAVVRLPRISNFTDFEPLARERGVRVAYVPLDGPLDADAVVLPGTKNTVDDLLALRESGMAERICDFDGPVVGVCGGYQLLGERITNAAVESASATDAVAGLGLLPVATRFERDKRVEPVSRRVEGTGPLAGLSATVTGYEIHMGRTRLVGDVKRFGESGAATDRVLGTYLHGLFENAAVRAAFVETVAAAAGVDPPTVGSGDDPSGHRPYRAARDLVATHVDLGPLGLSTDR